HAVPPVARSCYLPHNSAGPRPSDEAGTSHGGAEDTHQLIFQLEVRSNQIQEWYLAVIFHFAVLSPLSTALRNRAGLPITTTPSGTSLVTTLPAPTIAFFPITRLERIVAPDPIEAPDFTKVGSTCQSLAVCSAPSEVVARG